MFVIRRCAITLVIAAAAIPAFGQTTVDQMRFQINAPYELKKGKVVLPPGTYILSRVNSNDTGLFWLYKDDKRHAPIAIVETVPARFGSLRDQQKIRMVIDQTAGEVTSIEGWVSPETEGHEIIAVVSSRRNQMAASKQPAKSDTGGGDR
ncbi:MAG TPA: hypothetical protein VFV34_16520 [Blastocatellia bacterium]|nr:hypothetical protein [Blastocatellia bacterium]